MNSNVGCSFDLQVFRCQFTSYTAGLAPCKKALFFYTGSMDDGVLLISRCSLSRYGFLLVLSVLHGWAGAVQEGFILQHRKHGKCVSYYEVLVVF